MTGVLTDVLFVILGVWLVVLIGALLMIWRASRKVDRWSREDREETYRRLAR